MSSAIAPFFASGIPALRPPLPTQSDSDRVRLAPRLPSGAVLWDLRPLHEVQRAPVAGAVNLGQIDWLVEDRASGQLQPPSVIAKILARVGVAPGCSVVLFAGARPEALTLARRALLTIGIDQVEVIEERDEDWAPLARSAVGYAREEAALGSDA